MSGCMLMLSLWCLNRARSTSGKSSELGERRCMLLLTCHMISCFLAFLLQAIGHSFIPAGQNARLLLVGRIFLALAAGSIQAVGTGICEANWPNRCIWAILWLMTLCSTIGILVEGCGNTLLKTNSSHHEAWPQKENHLPNPIFQVRTLSFRESHVLFLLASFCCRSETICSFQKNGEFPYFVEHPSRVETTYWTHPPPLELAGQNFTPFKPRSISLNHSFHLLGVQWNKRSTHGRHSHSCWSCFFPTCFHVFCLFKVIVYFLPR